MSPAEAAAITEEPDWLELWDALKVADDGFEVILRRWREWHWTPVTIEGVEKKKMAPSVDGVIALALLGIMPPRTLKDRPPGLFEEQQDAHTWLVTEGRAWQITAIEDRMLFLDSFGEQKQIDLNRARWDQYCQLHAKALSGWAGHGLVGHGEAT